MLNIPALLANKSDAQLKAALEHLLAAHPQPVFGAAKQVEHEVASLRALKLLRALPDNADEYTFVITLRITKAKACNLLYQDALRTLTSPQQIDDALRALVMQPTATKDGDLILLEVPQPFLMDALRHRVRQLRFLSDGSFAGSIARLPRRALAVLIEDLVPPAERKSVAVPLRRQSMEGDDRQSLIPYCPTNQAGGPHYGWKRGRALWCSHSGRRRDRARERHSGHSQTRNCRNRRNDASTQAQAIT